MDRVKFVSLWPRWDIIFPDITQVVQYQQVAWKFYFAKKWFYLIIFGLFCFCFYNIVLSQYYFEYSNTFMYIYLKTSFLNGFVYVLYFLSKTMDLFYCYVYISDMFFLSFFYFKELYLNVFFESYLFLLLRYITTFLYYIIFVDVMSNFDFYFEGDSLLNSEYIVNFRPYKLYLKEKQKLLFHSISLLNSYNGFDRLSFFYFVFGDTVFHKILSPIVYKVNVIFYKYRINFVFDNFMFYMFDILKDFRINWFSKKLEHALKGNFDEFGYNLLLLDSEYSFELYKMWYFNNRFDLTDSISNNIYFNQIPYLIDGVYEKFLEANMVSTRHFQTNTNLYGTNYINMYYMLKVPPIYFYSLFFGDFYLFGGQSFLDIVLENTYHLFEYFTAFNWDYFFFGFIFVDYYYFEFDICNLIESFCFLAR